MTKNYEFRHQTFEQKAVLIGLRTMILCMLSFSIYSLALGGVSVGDQMRTAAGIFTAIWIYTNLLRVKIEIQELFVEPMNIRHGREFVYISLPLGVASYFF